MIEVQCAVLHTSFFLGGKSFATKLDAKMTGLKLVYDKVEKELVVEWKNHLGTFTAYIPSTNVASYEPVVAKKDQPKEVVTHKSHPQKKGIASAQVSTPMGHVFQGEGHGVTKS